MQKRTVKLVWFLVLVLITACFFGNSVLVGATDSSKVYVGGMPVGITLQGNGVLVIGKMDIITKEGKANPTENSDIEVGDLIIEIDGTKIDSINSLTGKLESFNGQQVELNVILIRKGNTITTIIKPALDVMTNKYKLGLWVRDSAAGVGTVTFIRPDGRFGALGHPIVDSDTGEMLSINKGGVHNCKIVGVVKGTKGKPGELRGTFSIRNVLGEVSINNKFGVYGKLDEMLTNEIMPQLVEIGSQREVKHGKAEILTTINGDQPQRYSIEIVKKIQQKSVAEKGMVIRITDKRLLETTGGIVQGMSGSPIIQNGKIIGAVTHVFINEPTKGYGMYIDWMLEQN